MLILKSILTSGNNSWKLLLSDFCYKSNIPLERTKIIYLVRFIRLTVRQMLEVLKYAEVSSCSRQCN